MVTHAAICLLSGQILLFLSSKEKALSYSFLYDKFPLSLKNIFYIHLKIKLLTNFMNGSCDLVSLNEQTGSSLGILPILGYFVYLKLT